MIYRYIYIHYIYIPIYIFIFILFYLYFYQFFIFLLEPARLHLITPVRHGFITTAHSARCDIPSLKHLLPRSLPDPEPVLVSKSELRRNTSEATTPPPLLRGLAHGRSKRMDRLWNGRREGPARRRYLRARAPLPGPSPESCHPRQAVLWGEYDMLPDISGDNQPPEGGGGEIGARAPPNPCPPTRTFLGCGRKNTAKI